jgi:hypothetical protein
MDERRLAFSTEAASRMGMASGLMIGPFTRLANVTEELANVRRTVCCWYAEYKAISLVS